MSATTPISSNSEVPIDSKMNKYKLIYLDQVLTPLRDPADDGRSVDIA